MKKSKAIYKIFDTWTGEYVKRSKDKEVWFSETWALSAGWDHACGIVGGGREAAEQYCILNLEIHKFPIEDAIVETWAARVLKNKAESADRKTIKTIKQINVLESQINLLKAELVLLNYKK